MSFTDRIRKRIQRLLQPNFENKIAPLVLNQATNIIESHNAHKSGKALFLDIGSNIGQGFRFFSQYYNPNIFDYWLIEANPFCLDQLKSNVSKLYMTNSWKGTWDIFNVAVSNRDGKMKLYGLVEDHRGITSDGASVVKAHNSVFYDSDESKALEVKSVKASKLIEDASKKYSTIVVKMDIEASEYDVLEDLIDSGHIEKLTHIYVEWHSQFFSADKRDNILARENRIKICLAGKHTDWH